MSAKAVRARSSPFSLLKIHNSGTRKSNNRPSQISGTFDALSVISMVQFCFVVVWLVSNYNNNLYSLVQKNVSLIPSAGKLQKPVTGLFTGFVTKTWDFQPLFTVHLGYCLLCKATYFQFFLSTSNITHSHKHRIKILDILQLATDVRFARHKKPNSEFYD